MRKSPDQEQKLLALLLAESPDASPFLTDILSSTEEIDWQRFSDLIERHRIGALVHAGLAEFPAIEVPAQLIESLEKSASDDVYAYLRAVRVTAELTKAFGAEGINSAALKGCMVAAKYYPTPAHREMIDVDILVDPVRYRDAEHIVQSHGFVRYVPRSNLSDTQRESFMVLHNAFGYIRKSDGVQLDLHWRMVHIPVMIPKFDADWPSMVETSDIAGRPVPTLNAAAHFVYMCVHGTKSGWTRLKWLVDVDRVLRRLSSEEQRDAAHIFETHNLERVGAASVLLSQQILGTPIPASFHGLVARANVSKLIDLECSLIFREMPATPHRLSDWRYFRDRIHHALILHRAKGYRRHTLLREVANPLDLETVPIPAKIVWALGAVSPIMGVSRALARTFKPKSG